MTTTETTAVTATAAGPILAIDLGKYKCVACAYGSAADHTFRALDTSRAELERLIRRTRPAVVVIEACGLAGWVHDLCAELGVPCRVANTSAGAWKFRHTKRKTDRDDALRLAQLYALGQLPEVVVPVKAVREWRALIAHRQALVTQRVAAQNRIRSILVGQGLPAPRGARAWTASGLAGIGRLARPLADCAPDELWRGLLDLALTAYRQADEPARAAEAKLDAMGKADDRVRLLDTVPGLGPRTAEAVVAHLGDPRRFRSGKQVAAYGGLVPRQYQSGEDDRRGRITKRGPAVLRELLVPCAWAMLRYNPWARAVYERLSRGKARKKQAVVALARKVLVRCWAMLRDNAAWRPDPIPAAAAGRPGPVARRSARDHRGRQREPVALARSWLCPGRVTAGGRPNEWAARRIELLGRHDHRPAGGAETRIVECDPTGSPDPRRVTPAGGGPGGALPRPWTRVTGRTSGSGKTAHEVLTDPRLHSQPAQPPGRLRRARPGLSR